MNAPRKGRLGEHISFRGPVGPLAAGVDWDVLWGDRDEETGARFLSVAVRDVAAGRNVVNVMVTRGLYPALVSVWRSELLRWDRFQEAV